MGSIDKRRLVMRMAICSQIVECLDRQEHILRRDGDDALRDIVRAEKKVFEAQLEGAEMMLRQREYGEY